jgi:integrase
VYELEGELADTGLAKATVRDILISLSSILTEAQARGLVAQNVVRARGKQQKKGNGRAKLEVGVDISSLDEIRRLIPHLTGPRRALLMTAIFTGLRASELRGLRWTDIVLPKPPKAHEEPKSGEIHVRQRADQWKTIGAPKSAAGTRTVPIPPQLVKILREHKLACPNSPLGLAFPNARGNVDDLPHIVQRTLQPAMIAAGLVTADGKPKYTGMHALRHAYASCCIYRKVDGGLELPLKVVQARLGHSSIAMTADVYGHLFSRGDDGKELADAAGALLG